MRQALVSLVLVAVVVTGLRPDPGQHPSQPAKMLIDSDPNHPWNRLQGLLYSRTFADGSIYDQESLEPLFLPSSQFLLEGASHQLALERLDGFLKDGAAAQIRDPVRRAILQRDIWAVFGTLAGDVRQRIRVEANGRTITTDRFEDHGDTELQRRPQRRAIQKRLAQIMSRIALSADEIAALPDNLAAAAKSGTFPREFDAKHPDRPFLPPDLLAKDGPWLAVNHPEREENGRPAALAHTAFTKGRSVFVVLLQLPGGRQATEHYLKTMPAGGTQFPEGTQLVLLRRALLIDRTGTLRESPLTESVEIRVYQKLDLGIPIAFALRRSDLFAGRTGGLRAIGPEETSYFDFQTRGSDVFEEAKRPPAQHMMETCNRCHARNSGKGGIHTVNTFYSVGTDGPPPGLTFTTPQAVTHATVDWVRQTYSWGLLQGMWESR
jgi:hypothetical protein